MPLWAGNTFSLGQSRAATVWVSALGYDPRMSEFTSRNISILVGSALIAFGLSYWVLDVDLAFAIGITAVYGIVAVGSMYLKGRNSP